MKSKSSNLLYPFKVWLFSLLISPVLILLFSLVIESPQGVTLYDFLTVYVSIIRDIGLYSIPSGLFFMAAVNIITRSNTNQKRKKINIQIAGIILFSLPFFILFALFGLDLTSILIASSGLCLATVSFWIWFLGRKIPDQSDEKELFEHLVE